MVNKTAPTRKCIPGIGTRELFDVNKERIIANIVEPMAPDISLSDTIAPSSAPRFSGKSILAIRSCRTVRHTQPIDATKMDDTNPMGVVYRWELPVSYYHKIIVIYPYPFLVVINLFFSWIIFINDYICILTGSPV